MSARGSHVSVGPFEHECEIVLETHGGAATSYECRIEFTVDADDAVIVERVDVWFGSREHGRWSDARNVLEAGIAGALYEHAWQMDAALFDAVSVEVEDRR